MKSVYMVLVAVLLVLLASPVLADPPEGRGGGEAPLLSEGALAREIAVQKRHEASLLKKEGVVGVGIGYRDGQKAIIVLVSSAGKLVDLPVDIEGVPVVQEIGEAIPLNGGNGCIPCHAGTYSRPVPMGVSTGPSDVSQCSSPPGGVPTGGTLGFKACDPLTDDIGYVTNSHVVSRTSAGCPNDPLPEVQHQPGRFDKPSCGAGSIVGTAVRYEPIYTSGNDSDAAFVISDDFYSTRQILDIGFVDYTPGTASLNACVSKSGRTTGLTHGRIDMVNVTHSVPYCSSLTATFVGSMRISADSTCGTCSTTPNCSIFGTGGDSGSAIVRQEGFSKRVVGLLFAGASNGAYSYANQIGPVLSDLGVTLDLSQCQ